MDHKPVHHYTLGDRIRKKLIRRNFDDFDWVIGGPAGPIKFIDLHQFEFAVNNARKGNELAARMLNLYRDGIKQLIVPLHGGACQYSTGAIWNNRNQLISITGQAITLQAMALGASLRRRKSEFDLGTGINSFVQTNNRKSSLWAPSAISEAVDPNYTFNSRLRGNAWYAMALHRFATAYQNRRLAQDAERLLDAITGFHAENSRDEGSVALPRSALVSLVAVSEALTYFGTALGKFQLLHEAKSLICKSVSDYAHLGGGYTQMRQRRPDPDAGIDIDCTIDLLRTCLALLKWLPSRRLMSIVQHGVAALFDPAVAMARRPEAGILIVADALGEVPTWKSLARQPRNYSDQISLARFRLQSRG
ncbi:MAG: hypothetical protein VCB07_09090 [Gammaproteobacteria bacterium]